MNNCEKEGGGSLWCDTLYWKVTTILERDCEVSYQILHDFNFKPRILCHENWNKMVLDLHTIFLTSTSLLNYFRLSLRLEFVWRCRKIAADHHLVSFNPNNFCYSNAPAAAILFPVAWLPEYINSGLDCNWPKAVVESRLVLAAALSRLGHVLCHVLRGGEVRRGGVKVTWRMS